MSSSVVKITPVYLFLFVTLLGYGWAQDDSKNSPAKVAHGSSVDSKDLVGNGRGAIARQKCMEYSKYASASKCSSSIVNISGSLGKIKAAGMEFPHMVAIGYQSEGNVIRWSCGGTLISETFVLTAAVCAVNARGGENVRVRIGDLNLERSDDGATPEERQVIEQILHPEYKPPTVYHDVALLRLESPVPFNDWIRPACLHTAKSLETQEATATGWGTLDPHTGVLSSDLMKVTVPLVDQQTCKVSWPAGQERLVPEGVIEDLLICAGAEGKDTCQGDAGGPLAVRRVGSEKEICVYDIIGITSTGKSCGVGTPALYTRVYNYVPWIESIVWA